MTSEIYVKSEQLLRFRIAFSLVSLCLCVGINSFAGDEFEFYSTVGIICGVSLYSFLALALVIKKLKNSVKSLNTFNGLLLVFDVLSLTGLIHFTHGIESDLYVLYFLPILLSSYVFARRGIYFTAFLVTVSYIGLLVIENASLLPYLVVNDGNRGLAAAFAGKLWRRILARAFFFTAVGFLWARFCEYLSLVSRRSNDRLLEQLEANEKLVAETEERAKRERLINSINKAVRSTLELDKMLEVAVIQLSQAVPTNLVAILCPPVSVKGKSSAPIYVEHTDSSGGASSGLLPSLQNHILRKKGAYELDPVTKAKIKTFVFKDSALLSFFAEVAADFKASGYRSLVIQPMMYGDVSKGVVILADKSEARTYTDSEQVLTKVVAGQVAVAIEHASLVAELSTINHDLLSKNLNLDAKNLELKTMQSQLIHQEKMASLGRLVAGIAHELNNPINFVHGNLPYLKQYVDELKRLVEAVDQLPEEQRQPVDELKKNLKYDFLVTDLDNIIADLNEGSGRIRHIIRDLKSFSRLDEAELKEASIAEGIESTLKILSQYYGRDKIPVESEFGEIPQVLCYPGQLNQVWMNLLSNAAQAMQNVPEPKLLITAKLEPNSVLVQVRDNGPGIKPEVQSKIFDPFFTTKPVGQGTGLGLSICHSIIERHGGQIWVESELGSGTTFFVRVPLSAKKQTSQTIAQGLLSEPD